MIFREATQEDIEFAVGHSASRGPKECPHTVDHVFCLEHDGALLAVGGLKMILPTTAWCWMIWSTFASDHTRTVYRVTKEWLDILMRNHELRRVMAAVEPDFPEAVRTVEALGFVKESVMPKFFGDRPGWLFVRFKEGE
jgi:RimJ/RimL family protein N-acetyltransferase